MYQTIFGPIPSRRFGLSLGIDLSPGIKQCNFDCLYCELEKNKPTDSYLSIISPQTILSELNSALNEFENLDVITITANGEPTLYPHLSQILAGVNERKGQAKSLILSNGSTIDQPEIQDTLLGFDIVKLSLDCVSATCFKKLDRPTKTLDMEKIIEGMYAFRQRYKGLMVLEILFVSTLNDSEEEIALLKKAIRRIGPDRVDIGTIDRPPAYAVKPLDGQSLMEIAEKFEGLPVFVAARKKEMNHKLELDENEIKNTLFRRPLTWEDMQGMFSKKTILTVEKMLDEGVLQKKTVGGVDFFEKPLDN